MEERFDDDIFDEDDRVLLIDGDIIVYRPCCIFTDDDDNSRKLIAANIKSKVEQLCLAADCNSYIMYLTTSLNFRDYLVDDYKANRKDVERPVNLKWAKMYAVQNLGGEYVEYLEADDLLAMNQKQDGTTVIWSLDKDLRQVPGEHLHEYTEMVKGKPKPVTKHKLITVTEAGTLSIVPNKKPVKYHFTGFKGLMFQALIGDTADYIVGCAQRLPVVTKSGKNKGKTNIKRVGVTPKVAYELLVGITNMNDMREAVAGCYKAIYKDKWMVEMEKQVNLLYMVENRTGDLIYQWTYDGRKSVMNIRTGGVICDDSDKE